MNAAASTANPLTTDIDDQPPWSDDMTDQGNPVLCEEVRPSHGPHQRKHQQLHITEGLASDELCEPSHNSSTHRTAARSGGSRYRAQMSLTLSTNSASVDSLKLSERWGCRPNARQIRL